MDIALVGVGKIARDQHIPAIANGDDFTLAATVSRNASVDGVAAFKTLDHLFEQKPDIGVVALCTPPHVRHGQARAALEAGKHVLLEKPPGTSLGAVADLKAFAASKNLTLFATWHSRFSPAVEPARAWLADKTIRRADIAWKEDVRHWHPGQDWVFEPGGFGVFDPGINALSILTAILPEPVFVADAVLETPQNRAMPIAARLEFAGAHPVSAVFDWRQTGPQTWDITVETDKGVLALSKGGGALSLDGTPVSLEPEAEYPGIYARFAELLRTGQSDVDVAPLRHVADAFMAGQHQFVAPFEW